MILHPWNGNSRKDGTGWQLPPSMYEGKYITDEGTVYYYDGDGALCIWCVTSRLGRHCHHLLQVQWRK